MAAGLAAGVLQQIARSKVMHGKPKAYWMPGDGDTFLAWLVLFLFLIF